MLGPGAKTERGEPERITYQDAGAHALTLNTKKKTHKKQKKKKQHGV